MGLGLPLVAWPVLERAAPAWIYEVASDESQARMERYVLQSVEAGDPVEKLRARLPQRFSHEIRTERSDVLGYRWRLEVEDGRIVDVWVGGR